MKPLSYMTKLAGSRKARHRFYIAAAIFEALPVTAMITFTGWLAYVRPAEANGLAGYSERHMLGQMVRYFSLGDEAVINGLMVWLMLASMAVVILLGWLWMRPLEKALRPEDEAGIARPN
ncbi:hypothetical protein [Asticcacaulis sp. EMRT-3]|uniref:hypothetical protein n=1 Tax=Asticcacaulis sp. EMRT-3 TaxID=3040349 RepID=UPI0024AEF734|nr:hypothetical protein [Asticcacaulis sp. EMRT-3]MDI7773966.1 hypothetical protein [Asticcacaulis sp. EMRT-3]